MVLGAQESVIMAQSIKEERCEETDDKTVSANGYELKTPETGVPPTKPVGIIYLECLKNHAANIGGHAVDGCCEFMSESDDLLKCAACGCHRNFHRKETRGDLLHKQFPSCGCGGGLHPSPPPVLSSKGQSEQVKSDSPPSEPVIPPYNCAPEMLLALRGGARATNALPEMQSDVAGRRRKRTKFTREQKLKMQAFAERIGWKLVGENDGVVHRFCEEIGIRRSVLKVWMHNNKNNFANKDESNNTHQHS